MADVLRVNGKSRWGGQLNPRPLGAENVTAALNRHSLRKLDGHGGSKHVSLLGIASKKRDSQQLQLESLFAQFQQLKVEKERLARDDTPCRGETCSLHGTPEQKWATAASGGGVTWDDVAVAEYVTPLPTEVELGTEPESEQRGVMTDAAATQPSVADDFGELLRQHSMTPAQRRPALPVPPNSRSASVDLAVRRAAGSSSRVRNLNSSPEKLIVRDGQDSIDRWLLNELALAEDSDTRLERKAQLEPEPEAEVEYLQLGPMTCWLQTLGLQAFAPQMLSVLPKSVVATFNNVADCQYYFEDLVRTKRGLAEVSSLCKACGMLRYDESILLRAVRAFATAQHIPSAPKRERAQNTPAHKPGRAAREAIKRRSDATAEMRDRGILWSREVATRPGLARSNRAADLRARQSHHAASNAAKDDDRHGTTRAPYSSVLLEKRGQLDGASGDAPRVERLLHDVNEHSDLASEVLESGRRLLETQERQRMKEEARDAAVVTTRKRLTEHRLKDFQMNI